jgi:hypothetical protein
MTNIQTNGDIARVDSWRECVIKITIHIASPSSPSSPPSPSPPPPLYSTHHSIMGNLRLGSTAPDFEAETTIGNIKVGTHHPLSLSLFPSRSVHVTSRVPKHRKTTLTNEKKPAVRFVLAFTDTTVPRMAR